jgi:beta-lactamase regulating signal transducer with metallopeptidase domain/protein involved in polysaccharide export with SLBB domain
MTLEFHDFTEAAWSQFLQVTVVILAVGLVTRVFCRKRPRLAHVLWLLVLVKCLTPPVWSSPTGLFCWATARHAVATVAETPPPVDPIGPAAVATDRGDVVTDDGFVGPRLVGTPSVVVPPGQLDVAMIVVILWLAGATIHTTILIAMRLGWSWRLRRSRVSPPADVATLLADVSRRLGIRCNVRLLVTSEPVGPAVSGVFRPILVLPHAILSGPTTAKLAAVLAHELIHVRRGDPLVGLWQWLVQTVWWFHPLVWWSNRELSEQRERCCDEEVLAGLGCDPAEYAQNLIDLLKLKRRLRPVFTFSGVRPVEVTSRRLESIMDRTRRFRRRTPRSYWLALAVGILALAPGAGLTLQGSPPADAPGAESAAAEDVGKPAQTGIRPLDLIRIQAVNTFPDQPINGVYLVDPGGRVSLGPAYGRTDVKEMSVEHAEAAVQKQLKTILHDPRATVTRAGRVTHWYRAVLPKSAYRIKPGDLVHVHALNTLIDQPIDADYRVEPSGEVSLGPMYKRVEINGMTVEEAQDAIRKHLEEQLREPKVAVTMADWKTQAIPLPTAPYRVAPGDLLEINALNTLSDQPIKGIYLVEPSGQVCLGPAYGRVGLNNMTVEKAEAAIAKQLSQVVREPQVAVAPAGWQEELAKRAEKP